MTAVPFKVTEAEGIPGLYDVELADGRVLHDLTTGQVRQMMIPAPSMEPWLMAVPQLPPMMLASMTPAGGSPPPRLVVELRRRVYAPRPDMVADMIDRWPGVDVRGSVVD